MIITVKSVTDYRFFPVTGARYTDVKHGTTEARFDTPERAKMYITDVVEETGNGLAFVSWTDILRKYNGKTKVRDNSYII